MEIRKVKLLADCRLSVYCTFEVDSLYRHQAHYKSSYCWSPILHQTTVFWRHKCGPSSVVTMWHHVGMDVLQCEYMRTAGYTWTDYKTNAQISKELKITQNLDKLLECKRSWTQHVNRMPRNRSPRVMKYYCPTGRRNHVRPLKRLLDAWDRNGSTGGPTPWKIYDDDTLD